MNGFIRGALGLALAATAGFAVAQPYGPPLAGGPPEHDRMQAPQFRDDMPGPDRHAQRDDRRADRYDPPVPPRGPYDAYDAYGFDRMGLTADGYDRHGYDAHGYDRYGFDPDGYTRDGFDLYGYDETGHDRYGRPAPIRRAEANPGVRLYSERRDHDDRDDGRYVPPPRYDPEGWDQARAPGYGPSYRYDAYSERGADRYGPARDDRYAYGPEVPSYGGAMQHFADPRCDTCRPAPVRYDCGCRGSGYGGGYQTSSVSVGPGFFYGAGGVGPIPDGGYYGGGGYVVTGGGASASSSAYASSSSRVSVSVRSGGGRRHGGCYSCGGHK